MYEITFDQTPNTDVLGIDTSANGIENVLGTHIMGTTYEVTMVGNPTFFTLFFGTSICEYGNSLPVELSSFRATFNEATSSIDVTWTTESETNNSHFNVYNNNIMQAAVGGQGTTAFSQDYYVSIPVQIGYNYIQLEQMDLDGKASWTEVIVVLGEGGVRDVIRFNLNGQDSDRHTFEVRDGELFMVLKTR
ncbi:MAG: hypothetical protein COA82_03540 [Alkaliphilus sp.]|nr:MAG: hypothetical protein COA82_03540 [Alkaliphilus sp.]